MKKKYISLLAGGLVVFTIALLVPSSRFWLLNNLGPMHPLVLHFPIGLLYVAFAMELLGTLKIKTGLESAVEFVLTWGAITAFVAALFGWFLHVGESYDEDLLAIHQWTGVGTAALAILAWVLLKLGKRKAYLVSFSATIFVLTVAGHFGGSLTHGEGFLTNNFDNFTPPGHKENVYVNYNEALVWNDAVKPILAEKCMSCHNGEKQNGGLMLVDSVSIASGGEGGKIIATQDAEGSEMYKVLVNYPLDHEHHMPPKGKVQLDEEEVSLIKWWIDTGAQFGAKITAIDVPEDIQKYLRHKFTPPHPADLLGVDFASVEDLQSLKAQGVRCYQIEPAKPWLTINLSDATEISDELWEDCKSVGDQVLELDLGNSVISDELMASISDFEHLRILKLDNTKIGTTALKGIRDLAYLEILNLYNTPLRDEAAEVLSEISSLQKVYVLKSGISTGTIEKLQEKMPELYIDNGQLSQNFGEENLIAPEFSQGGPFFKGEMPLVLSCKYPGVDIRYTLDGSEPSEQSSLYEKGKLHLSSKTEVRAKAYKEGWKPSTVVQKEFVCIKEVPKRVLKDTNPSDLYPDETGNSIIDMQVAKADFNEENWIGFAGDDYLGILDLGAETELKGIAVHAMEDVKSWIFYPKKVEVFAGNSPSNMQPVSSQEFDLTTENSETKAGLFSVDFAPQSARYVKVKVSNYGLLPEWHPGAGNPAWLFLDEIAVY